ncbi:MAG TPA: CPBP family intramembrane glutamic endopeptidase [Candidatus Acidoferrales bacterium]|nr:CPBP family intramembrane glutamic endopeptidase [Candidatus Acidoferrales bacterium]
MNVEMTYSSRRVLALAVFALLLGGFWIELHVLPLSRTLTGPMVPAFAGFALLLAPVWFFAFGAAETLRNVLRERWMRIAAPALLTIPYVLYGVAQHEFKWQFAIAMAVAPVVLSAVLEFAPKAQKLLWQDVVVLLALAVTLELRLLSGAWPHSGLGSLPKLYLCDVALYLYLVVRPVEGIGYSFVPRASAFAIGTREWLFFAPFAFGVGFALHFIAFYPRVHSVTQIAAGILVTFLLTAVPEEVFFRGILQNLLEPHMGRVRSLALASVLFGLSHFHKGAPFNWRYVVLATIAGIFYGRAWREKRQLLASSTTHTMVDVVWYLWFK